MCPVLGFNIKINYFNPCIMSCCDAVSLFLGENSTVACFNKSFAKIVVRRNEVTKAVSMSYMFQPLYKFLGLNY